MRVPFIGNPITEPQYGVQPAQRFINLIPEVIKNPEADSTKIFLQRRDAFHFDCSPNGVMDTVQEGRGIFYWNGWIFSVIGDEVWRHQLDVDRSVGVPVGTLVETLTTTTGTVGFAQFTGASDYLIICDGTKGYYINTSFVSTEITDVDFPTPHIPMPVYMDGYIFIQKLTGELFNCDAGDPTSWSASSYLTPENYADGPVALARQNNMVVALGEESVEFFYNAGNPSPGSPLSPYDQAVLQFGCAAPGTVAQEEGLLIFMARSAAGGRFITAVEGTKDTQISNTAINKILDEESYDSIGAATGYLIRMRGHLLYIINLYASLRSIVYDFETKYWTEFTSMNFDVPTRTYLNQELWLKFDNAIDVENRTFVQERESGYMYERVPYTAQDGFKDAYDYENIVQYNNVYGPIRTTAISYPFDAGTPNRKFCPKIEINGDIDTNGGDETFTISWSDNNGDSWSTPRSVIPDTQEGRMRLHRCGSFRRRKWKVVHTPPTDVVASNTIFRLDSLDIELNNGIH